MYTVTLSRNVLINLVLLYKSYRKIYTFAALFNLDIGNRLKTTENRIDVILQKKK